MDVSRDNSIPHRSAAGDLISSNNLSKSQPEYVPRDLKTTEINKICVLFFREGIKNNEDLTEKLETISNNYLHVMDKDQSLTKDDLSALFKETVYRYSKVTSDFDNSVKMKEDTSLIQQDQFCKYIKTGMKEGIGTSLSEHKLARPLEMNKEVQRFEQAYDRLKASEAKIENLSGSLKNRLLSKDVIYLDNIVLGGGDAATEYWLDMHKGSHGRTSELLNKNKAALPATLLLAKDTGNWKHDYTLAQTFSLLERGDSPANPQLYANSEKYQDNQHVNARFLYQSNVVNLSETEAPIVLGTEILSVEKKDKHPGDWKVDKAPCRINTKIKTESKTKEASLVISDAAVKNLYDSLKVTKGSKEQFANLLMNRLVSDNSADNYKTQVQKLTTQQIINLASDKASFEDIKKMLSLDDSITQVDFSRYLQKFMREIVADTLTEQRKTIIPSTNDVDVPYESLNAKMNSEKIPVIVEGKLIMESEIYINKHLYSNELNLCAGFGVAREISSSPWETKAGATMSFTPEQIKKEDKEILCNFDPNLNFTPVMDGNTFMLTNREETGVKRDIIIYGGGGNATACYRKAFFGEDSNAEANVYNKENQMANNITWFAREGFELAGYGRLAKQALTFAKDNDQLATGDLIRVEAKKDGSGKVLVYMQDTKGTYEGNEVKYSPQKDKAYPANQVAFTSQLSDGSKATKKVDQIRVFECDQFIYTIGQDGQPVKSMFGDYDLNKEAEVYTDPGSKMPLGVKTSDGALKFWGATAMVVSPSFKASSVMRENKLQEMSKAQKYALSAAEAYVKSASTPEEKAEAELQLLKAKLLEHKVKEYENRVTVSKDKEARNMADWAGAFGENLRDWIVTQRIARDAEWPGVMPPSRVSSRQAEFLNRNGLKLEDQVQIFESAQQEEIDASRIVKDIKIQLKALDRDITEKVKLEKDLANAQKNHTEAVEKVAKAQAKVIEAEKQFDYVNANLDDIEYINGFMIKAGILDKKTRFEFMAALLNAREDAYNSQKFPGVEKETIKNLITKFNLENQIEVRGNSSIGVKKQPK